MKIFSTKPDWLTESGWRALRTFFQITVSTILVALVSVLLVYANGGTFDFNYLWLQGVVLGVATAIAKLMNISLDKSDDSIE